MQTVREIEQAIRKLFPREIAELYAWIESNCPQPIDGRLAADLASGRLDDRIGRALAGHEAGTSRQL